MVRRTLKIEYPDYTQYVIFCPACGFGHGPRVPPWTFNGNMEFPTFRDSIRVDYYSEKLGQDMVCHSVVTDGKIAYCDDCTHEFKGQTLELPVF